MKHYVFYFVMLLLLGFVGCSKKESLTTEDGNPKFEQLITKVTVEGKTYDVISNHYESGKIEVVDNESSMVIKNYVASHPETAILAMEDGSLVMYENQKHLDKMTGKNADIRCTAWPSLDVTVDFYKNINYSALLASQNNTFNLSLLGPANDQLSSVKITNSRRNQNYKVILWRDAYTSGANYGQGYGPSLTLTCSICTPVADYPDLRYVQVGASLVNFNDRASAVQGMFY